MRTPLLLITVGISVAIAAALFTLGPGNEASGAGAYSRVLPGLAADSAPGAAPTATATPTPVPGGGGPGGDLRVTVIIRIRALELAATASGTLPVMIEASAKAAIPKDPLVVSGSPGQFSITDEGVDAVGCLWDRTDVSTQFTLLVYHSTGPLVVMGMITPQWHYTIRCPAPAPPIRSPAFGEESLELFLRDVMAPYLHLPEHTVHLPLTAASSPGCLKYYGAFSDSGIQADPAQVFVYVHEEPCALPPLVPLPTATPSP